MCRERTTVRRGEMCRGGKADKMHWCMQQKGDNGGTKQVELRNKQKRQERIMDGLNYRYGNEISRGLPTWDTHIHIGGRKIHALYWPC